MMGIENCIYCNAKEGELHRPGCAALLTGNKYKRVDLTKEDIKKLVDPEPGHSGIIRLKKKCENCEDLYPGKYVKVNKDGTCPGCGKKFPLGCIPRIKKDNSKRRKEIRTMKINDILNHSTIICNELRGTEIKKLILNRRLLGRVYSVSIELNTLLTAILLLNEEPNKHIEEDIV